MVECELFVSGVSMSRGGIAGRYRKALVFCFFLFASIFFFMGELVATRQRVKEAK